MKSKSNSKQVNSIASFIDSLLSPPPLSNPLKKSSSHKNLNDSITISKQINPAQPRIQQAKLSPVKVKSKSQDKAFQLFNNSKNYVEQISVQNSMIVSRASDVADSRTKGFSSKQVRFRENLIHRNSHYKRQFSRNDSRTPSILKKSIQVRNSTIQFLQTSAIQSRLQSNVERQPSHIGEDRQNRAMKTNEVVRKRYFTIIERFEAKFANKMKKNIKLRNDQKYKDELFPPILSSIARGGGKIQQNKSQKFKWMRISQLYKDQNLVVTCGNERSNIVIKSEQNNNFIADAFNSIKDCNTILSKMFESFQINDFGVYLVKIFQENVWKYVIVDDFLPVVQNFQGVLQPYFINCEMIDEDGDLEIWPFLLEKAYANYYANYESLHFGNTLDFLEQIMGISGELFQFNPNEKKHAQKSKRLQNLIQTEDTTFLGYTEASAAFVAITKDYEGSLLATLSRKQTYTLNPQNIYDVFDKVYAFNPANCIHSTVSTIGINIKKSNDAPRFDVSVRSIKVNEAGSVSISIRQKQKRFYQRSSLNYDYIWIRAILLQKQFDGDCRWIDAKYSNLKSINFFNKLEAGQYYIILLPEWKSSHCYELSLIVNSNVKATLARKQYDDRDQLMEKGCCDLAQRFGKLHQINLFACNYSFIHEQIGLLVENINNERYNGDIKINRSINGLKTAVDLVPFNIEFYQQKNNKLPFKTQISVYIQADKSYTVILMMRGGIDIPFLKKFDFGK